MPDVWSPLGALDDDQALHGRNIDGLPVLGEVARVHDYESAAVISCIANVNRPTSRALVDQRLQMSAHRWGTLVHPGAHLAPGVDVGHGSVVLAGVVVTAPQRIGRHVVVMPHVLLTHDDQIDDYATLAGGAVLGGGVHVQSAAYVGQGAVVREHVRIGAAAVVGMGSVVLTDVPAGETWAGVPAKKLR